MSTLKNKIFHSNPIRPKKVSGQFWSSVSFIFSAIFFLPTGKYVIHVYAGTNISHTQSMVAKRGFTNQANVHTPIQQFWRQFWTSFHSKEKTKINNADARV